MRDTELSDLSLAEKVTLLSGDGPWHTRALAGLPAAELSDGPHGLRTETGRDMVWIPSTCFPTASALASSWDPGLARLVARAIGEEAVAMGVQCVLGPGVNLKRDPRCGRNFEYFSEDPTLTASMASAWVDGLQSTGVAACVKHFAANNQETERTEISVEAEETTLRELYLEPFRRIITKARPWAVMCSYNRIWGVHASQHHWLLTQVLRDEWGYDGLVISDWDAVHDPVEALRAGLDLEMPGTDERSAGLVLAAVQSGRLVEADVDRAANRVAAFARRTHPADAVTTVRELGVVPGTSLSGRQLQLLRAEEHHQLARAAAASSCVLLRNEQGVLPLPVDGGARIAVVGAFARTPRIQGGGSSGVQPTRVDEPLRELRGVAGTNRLTWAQGYPAGATDYYREWDPVGQDAATLRMEAVAMAATSDVVIAFSGLPLSEEQEALDRVGMDLPDAQTSLLIELAALDVPLIVVLAAGSAVRLDPAWHDRCDAVLLSHLGGQGVGHALAELLFGLADPSGRLAETWPLGPDDTPAGRRFPDHGTAGYPEGLLIGSRWYDDRGLSVAYPFGHGLTYTTFDYAGLTCRVGAESIRLSVEVTNTGSRAGSEVVQVYLTPPPDDSRPRRLAGFGKVDLGVGTTGTVEIEVPRRDLARWQNGWRQTGGSWGVEVGASSRDCRLRAAIELDELRW